MKIIVKLILGTGFISLLLAACKKDEPVTVKTPTEKFIGKYTVYDTLVSVPQPECYTTDLHDEIRVFEIDIRAVNNSHVSISGFYGSHDPIGSIQNNVWKQLGTSGAITASLGYLSGDRIRFHYNYTGVCWPYGRATAIKIK